MLDKLKQLITSDNGVVLLGNVMASAFGLGIFMLLARNLSKADFGSWALFISTAGLLDLMRTGLVRQGMVRTAATAKESPQVILASAGVIAFVISIATSLSVFVVSIVFDWTDSSLKLFIDFYPWLNLATLPWNFDTWYMHAQGRYRRMNQLRLFVNILFILLITFGSWQPFTIYHYSWGFISCNALISIYSFVSLKSINWLLTSKKEIKELLNYGKHSLATLTGANLLKSADNLIIGALMGTESVAIFAIPMKALDLMEIPLRGFVMTAFRKLSLLHDEGQSKQFKKTLTQNISRLTIICIPIGLGMLLFPEFFIHILGGKAYEESYILLRILSIPLIFLPLDKFLGASLDSIGKPKTNAIKVWIMVIANVLGDFIAIWFFQSLVLVAIVTLVNIIMGVGYAWFNHPYLKKSWNSDESNQKSTVTFQ